MVDSPFDPDNFEGFKRWRDVKLSNFPPSIDKIIVEIKNPLLLTKSEKNDILVICKKSNHVIYHSTSVIKPEDVRVLGEQLGLSRIDHNPFSDDAVSIITDKTKTEIPKAGEYIPYTSSPIQWHTDGYYNPWDRQIRGFILHCRQDASVGGENEILDNEIVYLFLRDKNPELIRALMKPDVMTIPVNDDADVTDRPESRGPVFSIMRDGSLHMRYTARKKNVIWSSDPDIQEAKKELEGFLSSKTPFHFFGKLNPGQGIITNNSLHRRNGFTDSGENRVMFRARYYDKVV